MASCKEVNTLQNTDAAYIAGMIDGEGTIALSKRHKNENRQLVISKGIQSACLQPAATDIYVSKIL